jgi:mRNA interferase RelE/StbE
MGQYKIEWKRSAVKELKTVSKSSLGSIVSKVEELSENPIPLECRKLKGSDHIYRVRVGNYRIIYEVTDKELIVQIIRVRHRKDAYRKF